MIEKYKQSVPEEEFAENTVIERGQAKFIVSKIYIKDIDIWFLEGGYRLNKITDVKTLHSEE